MSDKFLCGQSVHDDLIRRATEAERQRIVEKMRDLGDKHPLCRSTVEIMLRWLDEWQGWELEEPRKSRRRRWWNL